MDNLHGIPEDKGGNGDSVEESNVRQMGDLDVGSHHEEITKLTQFMRNPNKMMGRTWPGRRSLPVNTVKMLAGREGNHSGRGCFSMNDRCHVMSRYLPLNGPWKVDLRNTPSDVSQFSHDGSFLFAAYMDGHIRIYDAERGWKLRNDIDALEMNGNFTDVSLSPDQHFLAYSSLSPLLLVVKTGTSATASVPDTTEPHALVDISCDYFRPLQIFSVKFSPDGRELVAGSTNHLIYIYDLNSDKISSRLLGHTDDVNTVCFADETGNVIYSGSDDQFCRVWDKRCYGRNRWSSWALKGHVGGITWIDSRGDCRYLISNGRDHTIKLWDIRKLSSIAVCTQGESDWYYRKLEHLPQKRKWMHPNDQSLATYKGHSARTPIRCYFSPSYSTGQKYIYTGSSDGSVHIFDLASGADIARLSYHEQPVRDCSWHPFNPMIVSSSWDGLVARWEFPGDDKAPILRKDQG